ncbi:hypothetical protein BBD42_12845 [Paenibacillus sp. BIHB 4019]|uniref:Acyl-CoA dehydrogenase n=2 Tax=Paenibacillus sp. BIHB 4019 TaxID=1870819 RepID=A0A1B2DHR5_9BACL|nr:hypothetical protein BBD42_12845 [Paenibacillus sp. BIHB 4019]
MFNDELLLQLVEQTEYTQRQAELLAQLRRIGKQSIGPAAIQVDNEGTYPYSSLAALKSEGLQNLSVPGAFGGFGAGYKGDAVLLVLALMELASWCSSTSQVFALHNTGVQLVHAMGDAGQQRFFFEEVRRGHLFGSFGSEAGANRFVLANTLRKAEGGYRLNGKKIFATGSPGAKWAFWRSVSDDAPGNQDERYMMPIAELNGAGITIHNDWDGIGQRGTGSGTVIAEDAFIPEAHVMGGPGAYAAHAPFFAAQFHIHFAAQYVGIAIGAFREAAAYLKEKARPWSEAKTAAEDPIAQLRVGEMAAKLSSAQQLVVRGARLLQAVNVRQGDPELHRAVQAAASHAKIIATDTALDVTNAIFQIMGARSATRSCNFDRYYRNARTLTLHDPVDKQREAAGKHELGL